MTHMVTTLRDEMYCTVNRYIDNMTILYIFSYAIILVEIATRMDPYSVSAHQMAVLVLPYFPGPFKLSVTDTVSCRSLVRQ